MVYKNEHYTIQKESSEINPIFTLDLDYAQDEKSKLKSEYANPDLKLPTPALKKYWNGGNTLVLALLWVSSDNPLYFIEN